MTSQDKDGYEHRQVAASRQAKNEERILGDKRGDDVDSDAATVSTGNTYMSILRSETGKEENSYSRILSTATAINDCKLPVDNCNYYGKADNASSLYEDRFNKNNNNNNNNSQTDRQDQGQQQELAASASAAAAQQCGVYDYVPDDDSNLYDVVGDGENESAYADIDDVVTAVNQGQGQMMEAYEEKPAVAVPAVRRSDKPRATAGGEDGVADVCSTYVRGNLSMASSAADRDYQLEDDLLQDYDHTSRMKFSRITKRIIMIGLLAGGIVLAVTCILVALLVDVKSVLMGKNLSVTTTLPSLLANAAAIIPDRNASAIRTPRTTPPTPTPWVIETTLTVMTTGAGVVFADGQKVADLPAMVLKNIVLKGEIKVVAITVTTDVKPQNRAAIRASAARPFVHNTKRLCTGFYQDWRCLDRSAPIDWYTSTYSMHRAWPISTVMNAKDLGFLGQSCNDKQCPFISSVSGGIVSPSNPRNTVYCRWVRSG